MFGLKHYYKKEKLALDIKIHDEKVRLLAEVNKLALACAADKGNYEHEYHYGMECLKVDIAKLEQHKESLVEDIEANKKTLLEDIHPNKELMIQKDNEIKRLTDIITKSLESRYISKGK
jgi:restriction endonuclease S subunit